MLLDMIVSACLAVGNSKPTCIFDVYRNEFHTSEKRCEVVANNRAERLRKDLSPDGPHRIFVMGECGSREKINHMLNAAPDYTRDLGGEDFYINDPAKER